MCRLPAVYESLASASISNVPVSNTKITAAATSRCAVVIWLEALPKDLMAWAPVVFALKGLLCRPASVLACPRLARHSGPRCPPVAAPARRRGHCALAAGLDRPH